MGSEVKTPWGLLVAKKMADGFIAVNTDVLSISRGNAMFYSTTREVGNRCVPFSFVAMELTGIPWDQIKLVYKAPGSINRVNPMVILGVVGTQRCLAVVRDRAWAGLVETHELHRDPLMALESLIPDKAKPTSPEDCVPTLPHNKNESFRSGEYYFIPRLDLNLEKCYIQKWKPIDDKDVRPHKVRDKAVVDGVTYIRGTIRHHVRRMASCRFWEPNGQGKRLVEPWYEVVKSNQVASWKGVNFWG